MTRPLWHWEELLAASKGTPDGTPPEAITGVSIDTRTIGPGDLFVALADVRDGHEFVFAAFAKGAAAALVKRDYIRREGDGALIRVAEPLRALESLGRAARTRLSPKARVVAVTGSAGKTGTKEMLRVCLATFGKVHASEKSYNNHWGVPLTLARMPEDTEFGVFEIGMNHAGEITPLSQMVRPHVAIITNVLPVHLGHFASVDEIAEAKSEIFAGLQAGGTAVLLRDSPHFGLLKAAAVAKGARVVSFGEHEESHLRLWTREAATPVVLGDMHVAARPRGGGIDQDIDYQLGMAGRHLAINSLAVVLALQEMGGAVPETLAPLAKLQAPQGRGARTRLTVPGGEALLVDESYNANPASMEAALRNLGEVERDPLVRRIAVLGDMLELGPQAEDLHVALAESIATARVDLLFAAGPHMRALCEKLPRHMVAKWAPTAAELRADLLATVSAGDVVMVKGSLGSKMGPLVDALRSQFGPGGRIGGNT